MKIEKLIEILKEKKMTIAVVESCSGGYTSYLLTKTKGSSKVFKGAIIAYSLEAKNKFFKIPFNFLNKTKGVSEKIALILAKKIRNIFNSDIGLSIVGFAGPNSRRGVKVGTVFIGLAKKNYIESKKIIIEGERNYIRKKVSLISIKLIYDMIK
ncbi:MAG: CinA family protein [Candidatus Aenigmatarchaeota archaeon]